MSVTVTAKARRRWGNGVLAGIDGTRPQVLPPPRARQGRPSEQREVPLRGGDFHVISNDFLELIYIDYSYSLLC